MIKGFFIFVPGIAAGKSKKSSNIKSPQMQMPSQNLVSPLQYSAMLKLYSTTSDDPPNFKDPEKSEIATRDSQLPSRKSEIGAKKSSFEGKEYSRLSTNEKEEARNDPETVFSSSADDSDIPESKSEFRWDGKKLGDRNSDEKKSAENEVPDGVKITQQEKKSS